MCGGGASSPNYGSQMVEQQRELTAEQARYHDRLAAELNQWQSEREAAQGQSDKNLDSWNKENAREVDARTIAANKQHADLAALEKQKEDLAKQDNDQQNAHAAAIEKDKQDQNAQQLAIDKQQADMDHREAQTRLDAIAQQESQRQQDVAAADRAAGAARDYSSSVSEALGTSVGNINREFGQFDDNYYNKFAGNYLDYYMPQLQQQYEDTAKANVYSLSNRGNLDSSAAAYQFGRLAQTNTQKSGELVNSAVDAARTQRAAIEGQRSSLISQAFQAAGTAPDYIAKGVGSGQTSMQLGSIGSGAGSAAAAFSTPQTYAPLANAFTNLTPSGPRGAGSNQTSGSFFPSVIDSGGNPLGRSSQQVVT